MSEQKKLKFDTAALLWKNPLKAEEVFENELMKGKEHALIQKYVLNDLIRIGVIDFNKATGTYVTFPTSGRLLRKMGYSLS